MRSNNDWPEGTLVLSRDGRLEGRATGSTHKCRLEGCKGQRVAVRWSDGHYTYPCSRGLKAEGKRWVIA